MILVTSPMRHKSSEVPIDQTQIMPRKTPLLVFPLIIIITVIILISTITTKYPYYSQHKLPFSFPFQTNKTLATVSHSPPILPPINPNLQEKVEPKRPDYHEESSLGNNKKCDLFNGEWVPNPEAPYYTNTTCEYIEEQQNCMKFGRPDTGFLKWRWRPAECELRIFDPHEFLELVRGKSMAFIGDSVARNHVQSLICLLSRVVHPEDGSSNPKYANKQYIYRQYNFNMSFFFSPYLIRTNETDFYDGTRSHNLYLDEFDETWTDKIQTFDYIIISGGHWFYRSNYFYLNRTLTGCLYCPGTNITQLPASFSYHNALQTAFRAINSAINFKGITFLRTFVPTHFEGGEWDKGGDCVRMRPFKRREIVLEDFDINRYEIQLDELRIAQRAERRNGGKFRLFDVTKAMLLRPDGHPSKYGKWPVANQATPNDCLHWCLP